MASEVWNLALKQMWVTTHLERLLKCKYPASREEILEQWVRGVAWVSEFLLSASPNQVIWLRQPGNLTLRNADNQGQETRVVIWDLPRTTVTRAVMCVNVWMS